MSRRSKPPEPVRRAGMRIGLNGKCPLPTDGLGDAQNRPRGEYSAADKTYRGTSEQPVTAGGKGNPGSPAAERANERQIRGGGR